MATLCTRHFFKNVDHNSYSGLCACLDLQSKIVNSQVLDLNTHQHLPMVVREPLRVSLWGYFGHSNNRAHYKERGNDENLRSSPWPHATLRIHLREVPREGLQRRGRRLGIVHPHQGQFERLQTLSQPHLRSEVQNMQCSVQRVQASEGSSNAT